MGDGSETQRGRYVPQQSGTAEDGEVEVEDRPTRPSSPLEQDPRLLLLAIRDRDDVRSIDLRRVQIQLSVLTHVSRDLASERQILPLAADGDRLLVAVADPMETSTLDDIGRSSGRSVLACVPLDGSLRAVIDTVYAAASAGASVYTGPLARPSEERVDTGESLSFAPEADRDDLVHVRITAPPAPVAIARLALTREPEAKRNLAKPQPAVARRKMLLADADDEVRRKLARVFADRGFDLLESRAGGEALQMVRDHEPDVLVIDALLPEIHGFDLCRRIKSSRRYGHLPVIMMSGVHRGWRFAEDLRRSYGVADLLEKPFQNEALVAAVTRALDGGTEDADGAGAGAWHLEAALAAYARDELDDAIEQLKRGIAVEPLGFPLHYHLGLLYGKQGNVFDAIQALERAVELKPRDFPTLKNLGVLYQQAGFRLKAAESWERALGCAPDEDTRASIRNHVVSLL